MRISSTATATTICLAALVLLASSALVMRARAAEPTAPAGDTAAEDLARKAEIMNSTRWRRAIFELGEWLSSQQIYTPDQVHAIKADFNRRVAGMSSYELEYLLDDLDAKFKVMDSPEARDARAWVGQYLAAIAAADAAAVCCRESSANCTRWRRAIFELGEWLSSQQIYTPDQVHAIKADFNRRVAGMSSYELEYLLDDLDAKFKVMDSPEARDARAWVGQYLAAMSDQKRAETLKDVPDIVKMSAGQLEQEIGKIEAERNRLQQRQAVFDQSRTQRVQFAEDSRQQTAAASAAAMAQARASFSPYRSQGSGEAPFANVRTGSDMEFMGWGFGFF